MKCNGFTYDLAKIARIVATGKSVDDVLWAIVEETVSLCGCDMGFLAIVNNDLGQLDLQYVVGRNRERKNPMPSLKVNEKSIISYVATTQQSRLSTDVRNDEYYIEYFPGMRSELAVPLVDSNRRTRGVLNLESSESDTFTESRVTAVEALVNLATSAITISDHADRESALIQIGRELNEISELHVILQRVIDVTAKALRCEHCSLFLIDETTGKLVLRATRGLHGDLVGKAFYDIGEGLTGSTVKDQRPIRLVNPAKDRRWAGKFQEVANSEVGAYVAVPVYSRQGVIGVIRAQRCKSVYHWFPNDFTDDDERILTAIAAQLGVALDNARLVEQLVKTERMAAWGEMSARLAHMIGNRVFAIKGDINELEYQMRQNEIKVDDTSKLTDSIKSGIFMLEGILSEFREFVKATHLDLEEVSLNDIVKEAVDEGLPKRLQIKTRIKLGSKLPGIMADPIKLKRCFSELIENSVSFRSEGQKISVTTSPATLKSIRVLKPGNHAARYVQVKFEDKGPGVDQDDKSRIFDAFFTSRAKGMGLGLSIVKSIVEAHGGTIYENGTPGKGAKFTIVLPCEEQVETS